jgi:hypothetical protein
VARDHLADISISREKISWPRIKLLSTSLDFGHVSAILQ